MVKKNGKKERETRESERLTSLPRKTMDILGQEGIIWECTHRVAECHVISARRMASIVLVLCRSKQWSKHTVMWPIFRELWTGCLYLVYF